MSKLLRESGLVSLLKLVFTFEDNVTRKKLIAMAENDPSLILGFLDKHIVEMDIKEIDERAISTKLLDKEWLEEKTKDYLDRLKLTRYQVLILKAILKHENKASLEEIEAELKGSGIEITTGSAIGGSIAGITKKCNAYKIPTIFKSKHYNSGDIKYFVVDSAKKGIETYLE